MKGRVHSRIVAVLTAALMLVVSCIIDLSEPTPVVVSPFGLSLIPQVFRAEKSQDEVKTKVSDEDPNIHQGDRVDARDDERENFFRSLDVFVVESTAAETDPWFKTYHLKVGETAPAGQGPWQLDTGKYLDGDSNPTSLLDEAKNLLASNWATEGYDPNKRYNIYATANNPHTMEGSAVLPENLSQLKALTTNTQDIYRYSVDAIIDGASPLNWTNWMFEDADNRQKEFLMDGKIEGWTIDPNSSEQVFEVPLSRAAAKIIVNVKFDGTNETVELARDDNDDEYWTHDPKPDSAGHYGSMKHYLHYVNRTVGVPRWKPVNFALTGADVADGAYLPTKANLYTYDRNFNPFVYDPDGVFIDDSGLLSGDNVDNKFTLVTYTYPVDWTSGNSAGNTDIPFILLSFGYSRTTGDNTDTKISYYRIPVCDEQEVSKLERNNIYIVDVTISSMGSSNENLDLEDQELRIEYHVVPWQGLVTSQEVSSVTIAATKYLTVTPKEYTLKGDGVEEVDLNWYASTSTDDGQFVDIDNVTVTYVNYLGNTVDIKGTVTKTPQSPDGTQDIVITSTAPTSGANGETVTLTITPGGVIKVESQALASRAVKTITFDVKLRNTTLDAEHVVIKHYPLDNIQSFTGSWSSRWNETYQTGTLRQYSFNPTADGWVAEGWSSWGDCEENVECTLEEYNHASDGKSTSTSTGTRTVDREEFLANVTTNDERTAANGQANAVNGYWGETARYVSFVNYSEPSPATSSDNWDFWSHRYYESRNGYRTYGVGNYTTYNNSYIQYKYQNYYTNKTVTRYYARRYYRDVTTQIPQTGSWVAWGEKNGTTTDGTFTAKVYYNGYCYSISNQNTRGSVHNNLTNNHMYVIQVTSTSTKYALGYPVLDGNYQSQDKVVAPAFMIASQLGAVQLTNSSTTASTHCGTYMEVGTDGTRYVGWRLPTKQEIEVIIGYQNGDYTGGVTMVEVLGGQYYWALDGTTAYVSTGSGGSTTSGYIRCVRDLTLEDLNRLNGN